MNSQSGKPGFKGLTELLSKQTTPQKRFQRDVQQRKQKQRKKRRGRWVTAAENNDCKGAWWEGPSGPESFGDPLGSPRGLLLMQRPQKLATITCAPGVSKA